MQGNKRDQFACIMSCEGLACISTNNLILRKISPHISLDFMTYKGYILISSKTLISFGQVLLLHSQNQTPTLIDSSIDGLHSYSYVDPCSLWGLTLSKAAKSLQLLPETFKFHFSVHDPSSHIPDFCHKSVFTRALLPVETLFPEAFFFQGL